MTSEASKRILVVDDEEMMRSTVSAALTSVGYEVLEADNGRTGLQMAKTHVPDLIVCDVKMPELDGFELLQELRKSDDTFHIPFVFLTGQTDHQDRRKGMMFGADDYLTKPFTFDELVKVVELRLKKKDDMERLMNARLDKLRKSIRLSLPHEFRTPLTGILGFAEILKEPQGLSQDEIMYAGSHIQSSAKRLHHLLENILLMSELEAITTDQEQLKKLRSSVTSSGFVLSQLVEPFAQELNRKEDVKLSIHDVTLRIYETHFGKIVEELTSNALKFSPKGTPVEIALWAEGAHGILEFRDKGKGMTPQQIQSIGAFAQFDREYHEQQGAGMGLAIVKKIVHLYEGSLVIESVQPGGTTVRVTLLLAE